MMNCVQVSKLNAIHADVTLITIKTNTKFTCTHTLTLTLTPRTHETYIIISKVVSGELTKCKIEFCVHTF